MLLSNNRTFQVQENGKTDGEIINLFKYLFLYQPPVLFIDVILNKYFRINLQQEEQLEDKNQDQLSHCRN